MQRRSLVAVDDVFTPRGRTLRDGDVCHEMVVGGAVPMHLATLSGVNVTRTNFDNVFSSGLHAADAFDDV